MYIWIVWEITPEHCLDDFSISEYFYKQVFSEQYSD